MTLGELILFLESQDQNKMVPIGFKSPHSYRGYYEQLAFEPANNVKVCDMLECAREAVGTTYCGWKGGDFEMSEYTEVNLAEEGHTGESIGPHFLCLMMLAQREGDDDADTKGGE